MCLSGPEFVGIDDGFNHSLDVAIRCRIQVRESIYRVVPWVIVGEVCEEFAGNGFRRGGMGRENVYNVFWSEVSCLT